MPYVAPMHCWSLEIQEEKAFRVISYDFDSICTFAEVYCDQLVLPT
jgi:hypothetical protein